jgi:hypothetical protein
MFPRLREQIGTALDLFVEFSTLGEYRLAGAGNGASSAPAVAPGQAPQLGGASAKAPRAAVRRTVAGGATGTVPVATPAARRLRRPSHTGPARTQIGSAAASRAGSARVAPGHVSSGRVAPARRSRVRGGAPAAPEQLCFAV